MKTHRSYIIVATLVLLQSALVAVSAPQSIGSVVAIKGRAFARSVEGKQRTLKNKSPILMNDTIITGADSQVQLLLKDDTAISQGENSEITIDEYLYTPDKKEENVTSITLTKGIFRVITGKITRLNPDRFRVKTSSSTIGIRGCDVLIRVTPQGHDVFVLELHGFDSVTVQTIEGFSTLEQKLVEVLEGNNIVSITQDGVTQRPTTAAELIAILTQVGNHPSLSGNNNNQGGGGEGEGEGDPNGNNDGGPDSSTPSTFTIRIRPPVPDPYDGQQL